MDARLGKSARDRITGFTGTIIGTAEYLFGCRQLALAPPAKDGKIQDTHWFDEGRVEVTGPGISAAEVAGPAPGGPNRDAPRL